VKTFKQHIFEKSFKIDYVDINDNEKTTPLVEPEENPFPKNMMKYYREVGGKKRLFIVGPKVVGGKVKHGAVSVQKSKGPSNQRHLGWLPSASIT
jgi:hypothetical protein